MKLTPEARALAVQRASARKPRLPTSGVTLLVTERSHQRRAQVSIGRDVARWVGRGELALAGAPTGQLPTFAAQGVFMSRLKQGSQLPAYGDDGPAEDPAIRFGEVHEPLQPRVVQDLLVARL